MMEAEEIICQEEDLINEEIFDNNEADELEDSTPLVIDFDLPIKVEPPLKPLKRKSKLDKFLIKNHLTLAQLQHEIKKSKKLYKICKSKRSDKKQKRNFSIIKKKRNKLKKRKRNVIRISSSSQIKSDSNWETDLEDDEKIQYVSKADDSVRDKIRAQLDLLRNAKRPAYVPTLIPKNTSELNESLYKSICAKAKTSKISQLLLANKEVEQEIDEDDGSPEPCDGNKKGFFDSDFLIKPTKTGDITKIKGWRKKIFSQNQSNPQSLSNKLNDINKSPEIEAGVESLSGVVKKSAFESEALDNFLINAKLNISYEVPKLIAEEGISEFTNTVKVPKVPKLMPRIISKFDKKCKAKTLAEKRKMLEIDRQKELLHEMEINENSLVKQLRRDEKKLNKIERIQEIRNALINQTIPVTRECWKLAMKSDPECPGSQIVRCGNENITVCGSTGGPTIDADEKYLIKYRERTRSENIILLDEVRTEQEKLVKNKSVFRPGPLSKKPELCNIKSYAKVVKLPKIFLQVQTKIGKKINPYIEHLIYPNREQIITKEWANFATSTLPSKFNYKIENVFSFHLPYAHNQEKILVNKVEVPKEEPKLKPVKTHLASVKPKDDIELIVKNVLHDLLDYLDTPVLDNSKIEYCPDCPKFNETELTPTTPLTNNIRAVLNGNKKRKLTPLQKTELELRRLNVQVIDVNINKRPSKVTLCTKPECILGCVCLDTDVEWPQHCGKQKCIFECLCPPSRNNVKNDKHQFINFPEGCDIFTAKTVENIRDHASRNLAKEERKFTQTVIRSNDQTIVVGDGERRRRATKAPVKYTDFIDCDIDKNTDEKNETQLEKIQDPAVVKKAVRLWQTKVNSKKILSKQIVPLLDKIELNTFLPWCMVHNLYKCFCKGQALEDSLTVKPNKIVIDQEQQSEEYITYSSKRSHAVGNPFAVSDANICARIRGVPNFYLSRNKSQYFRTRNVNIKTREQQSDPEKLNLSTNSTSSADVEIYNASDAPIVGKLTALAIISLDQLFKFILFLGISPKIEPELLCQKTNDLNTSSKIDSISKLNSDQPSSSSVTSTSKTRLFRQNKYNKSCKYNNSILNLITAELKA